MATHPQSLYGYAYLIRSLLRGGGPSVDDDKYSLRVIAAEILAQAAIVRQTELYDLDRLGYTPDVSQMVPVELTLIPYQGATNPDLPVVLKQASLPSALSWRGDPAIFGLTTRPDQPGFSVKSDANLAVNTAIKRAYLPARPAGWIEANALGIALPLTWSGVKKLKVRYIPSAINIGIDGNELDVETQPISLTNQQWAKVQPLVMQAISPMLQTTANSDTRNNGKDDSAQ